MSLISAVVDKKETKPNELADLGWAAYSSDQV